MTSRKKRELSLFIASFCFWAAPPCHPLSLGKLENDFGASKGQNSKWIRVDPGGNTQLPENKGTFDQRLHKSNWPGSGKLGPGLSSMEKGALLSKLEESGVHLKSLSWSSGNVSQQQQQRTPGYKSAQSQQADSAGPRALQGEILGVSPDTTHLSEWLDMRPLVLCDENVMTFSASGGGFTNLFVGRDGGAPISLFDLPSFCGYNVKTRWGVLEITIPYDACFVIEEDGNIVLPLLWWGSPLKLSCPVQRPHPPPSVQCSPHGMVVQIIGHEDILPTLGFKVNGRWGPLLAEECASLVLPQKEKFLFFIPTTAACLTIEFGVHLWLIIDELEYTLTCPPFLSIPPSSPNTPQFPFYPDPVGPAPPSTALLPTPPYLDPISLHPHFPRIYPPAPVPPKLPLPTKDAPPGPRPQHYAQSLQHYFEGGYIKPFTPHSLPVTTSTPVVPIFNVGKPKFPIPHDLPHVYNPYAHFFHATKPSVPPSLPPVPELQHFHLNSHVFQMPYHHAPQTTPSPAPSPRAPPLHLQFPLQTDASYNPFHFHHQASVNLGSPPSPPEPHTNCFPYGDKFCSYYPSPYYPYYHQPQTPKYPPKQPPSPDPPAPPQTVQHHCLGDRVFVLLPSAHPDSIQIKVQTNLWIFLSNMPSFCGYDWHRSEGLGVVLQISLPGCHMSKAFSKFDTSSLSSLRYWDLSLGHFRIVDVNCPSPTPPPHPPYPPVSPAPPFIHESAKESCSGQHMTIEFPAGPISEISIKDIYGNRINVQDVSKDCGYSVNMGKDGKLRLSIPLHLHCHMTLQGSKYTITIVYTAFYGTREAQFSCPGGVFPISAQECNLALDKRLPCGPAFVSQTQCASLGCCFDHRPPACYYPMDECTADRHFVFSVPASLTEPPLSLPLLIAGGNSSCRPERVTSESALFRIPMDSCGARRMQVGKNVIYLLEVNNIVNSISLNYGTITRDSPVRLLVECRFVPGSALTVSYLVKTPTLGPTVQTQGVFGVQLRIAKDSSYQSYYPQHHQPLQVLLGKPLYLEVRLLNSPDPSLVLLVDYCVAYPRSGKAVWVLLYNGCPNPLDPHPNQVVDSNPQVPLPAQTRRFTISTFQFLPDGKLMDSNEEIYIMCGTELCSTRDSPCVEGCFAHDSKT